MANIYQSALDAKFGTILDVVVRELGYSNDVTGLTAEQAALARNVAEQAILNWTVARRSSAPPAPVGTLDLLLEDYCALADHL